MFSKLYKALYKQRWFRQGCLMAHWRTMRKNPFAWDKEQPKLDKVFGKRPIRSPKWKH